jgi:sterol desaturase/sphingolipid hydroxylase (fatty acid hydroxylase superfamily)
MNRHPAPGRVHWAHLALLGGLLPWWFATHGAADTTRLGGWLGIAFLVLLIAERRAPYRRDWTPTGTALQHDAAVLSLNLVADALAGGALAWLAMRMTPDSSPLPLAVQVFFAVALGELASYALHRASHAEGWLWRVHLLHHRPVRLNVANALTAHPINAIYEKLGRVLPAMLLGLSPDAILIASLFVLTQTLVAHANVAGSLGPLNWVLGTAELHRLHHSTQEAEAGNFGTAVPWWDLAFGTYRAPRPVREVGVFDPAAYPEEFELAKLLGWPFRVACVVCRCCMPK